MTHIAAAPQQDRFSWALQLPNLVQKCSELTTIVEDVHAKDAGTVFQAIVEDIFGIASSQNAQSPSYSFNTGWNLKAISSVYKPAEFEAVRCFLSAKGPFMALAFRVTNEPFHQFVYPISWLSLKVRQEIDNGNTNAFFANKIESVGPGKTPTKMLLNAFEFYVFHFAQSLTNVRVGSSYGAVTGDTLAFSALNDALYPVLVEDLLATFLPCDASVPPGPSAAPVTPRVLPPLCQRPGSLSPPASALHLSSMMSPIYRPQRPPDGRYTSPSQMTLTSVGGLCTSSPLSQSSTHPMSWPVAEVVTWSSEVVLQVLLQTWINEFSCVPTKGLASSYAPFTMQHSPPNNQWPSGRACYTGLMQDRHSMQYFPNWMSYARVAELGVPSCDQVKMVRILIKHLHYFANSIKPQHSSILDPLRRSVWSMCSKSIYRFLKHLFLHWPFDSSFRLVLETWLSYIQPWRYTNYHQALVSEGADNDKQKGVDKWWLPFISDNLLFYVHLFDLLLARLLRLDLVCPKNSQILFRATKVYSQEKLVWFVEEIEGIVGVSQHGKTRTVAAENDQTTIQSVLSHISEMEGARYHFEGIRGKETTAKASQLIRMIKMAEASLTQELSEKERECGGAKSSTLSSIYKYFSTTLNTQDDIRRDEITKCLSHLDLSLRSLCAMFQLPAPADVDMNHSLNASLHGPNNGVFDRTSVPEQAFTHQGHVLTQTGRMQMLRGWKRLDIQYEGDADLRPICSYEISLLVRFLYTVASFLNNKYEGPMVDYFYRKDFVGRIARVILQPPITVYETVKCIEGRSEKSAKTLPPRLTLRPLANKHLNGLILACWLIFSMFGVSLLKIFLNFALPLLILVLIVKAFLEPPRNLQIRIDNSTTSHRQT